MKTSVLELKNLKKYYGSSRGIENVTLNINEGEIYGFIGPNGAGKSTTIRTIMGLINKTSGAIFFNRREININDPKTKEKIGYLPSELNLYEEMKVKDIFDFHAKFYKKNISKRKNELVKLLKIDVNKKIEDLSLGNQKKVGIVLALMHEPELLILDEPTSGLDPIMQKTLHEIILKEKEKGTTILYSSHILSEVSLISDRIGLIKDGVIIKEDTMENINKLNSSYLTIKSKDIDSIKKELKLEIKEEYNDTVKFLSNMDINKLISILSKYDIDDMLIENISLEDLFINYYK